MYVTTAQLYCLIFMFLLFPVIAILICGEEVNFMALFCISLLTNNINHVNEMAQGVTVLSAQAQRQ